METASVEVGPSDEDLAALITRRSQSDQAWEDARSACGRLYNRHGTRLLAFLSSRVSSANLEDVHQAVWQRVWERLPKAFDGKHFRAWLYQIARNLAIDYGRKKHPRLLTELKSPAQEQRQLEEAMEEERMAALSRCLERLSKEAATLVRARLAGEGYVEASARLGLEPEQAHRLFHHAKEQLRTCVQEVLK
jgi:RNA polymerase sigma-70 factor (ECF subfamily)